MAVLSEERGVAYIFATTTARKKERIPNASGGVLELALLGRGSVASG